MKLKELSPDIFQINKDINFDVSLLYFDYAEKEIYELLKQNILTPGCLSKGLKVKPVDESIHRDLNYFQSFKYKEINDNYYHLFLYIN